MYPQNNVDKVITREKPMNREIGQDMDRVPHLMRNIDVMIRLIQVFRRIMGDPHPLRGMVSPRTVNRLIVNSLMDTPRMDTLRMGNRLMDNPRINIFRRGSEI
jgi:hypothetical protein